MKTKIRSSVLLTTLLFVLVSCGGSTDSNSTQTSSTSTNQVRKMTITFQSNGGSSVTAITVDEGSQVSKPKDPTKNDNYFKGWYYDSKLTDPVTWPLTLNENITVYAKWQNSRDFFLESRDATINGGQFEYDFNLDVTTTYGPVNGPGAFIDGNVKYNSSSQVSYLQKEVRSGLLLSDVTLYKVKTGDELATFKVNDKGKLIGYDIEQVSSDYKYDTSSFAKALFEFTADQITSVPSSSNGKFKINFSGAYTGLINSALNFLNHPIVDSILSQWVSLPNHDSNLSAYVTFENEYIKTYEYDFTITVAGATLNFHYDLTFKKVGNGVTITAPDFGSVAISDSAKNAKLNVIKAALDSYRSATYSGYNYRVDTMIDYPKSFAIDATIQGRTMRKVENGTSYFWNRVKLDSDYKNNDLYKAKGVVDYERYRVKYANKDVYDIIDGVFSNTYTKIDDYNNDGVDSYYFLLPNSIYTTNNISTVEEKTENNITKYSLGLTSSSITSLFDFVDHSVRFDIGNGFEFNIFNVNSDLDIKSSDFTVQLTNGDFTGLTLKVTGRYVGAYSETEFSGPLDFELKLEIVTNNKGDNYKVPTKNSEVDLSNS